MKIEVESKTSSVCSICGIRLTDSGLSLDCGGDCLSCMAKCGDVDCQKEVEKLRMKHERNKSMNKPNTKLVGKEYSPLIIRRYSMPVLMFVALITDDDLDDLDDVVNGFFKKNPLPNSIQGVRNRAGALSDTLAKKYPKTEGVAVIIQADKMTCSSLAGDFMNATPCRIELYSLLQFATNV